MCEQKKNVQNNAVCGARRAQHAARAGKPRTFVAGGGLAVGGAGAGCAARPRAASPVQRQRWSRAASSQRRRLTRYCRARACCSPRRPRLGGRCAGRAAQAAAERRGRSHLDACAQPPAPLASAGPRRARRDASDAARPRRSSGSGRASRFWQSAELGGARPFSALLALIVRRRGAAARARCRTARPTAAAGARARRQACAKARCDSACACRALAAER
jgi:hypothetical protein